MINAAEQTIRRCDMLKNGDSVVVALSGGADSVSLLHCLISIKEKYNLTIYAAHLNHMLRGEEAERDESFCKILCKNYNIELFVRRVDIKSLANEQKIGEELCGRQQRYSFFEELSEKLNAKIATAHTASDNAETLLFQLCRGASVTGAAGSKESRTLKKVKSSVSYIKNNYSSDLTLEEIASVAGLSRYHFCREFKKATDLTPIEFINRVRCERAKTLLEARTYSVSEISSMCGFATSAHFSKIFKRFFLVYPSEYIKISRSETEDSNETDNK